MENKYNELKVYTLDEPYGPVHLSVFTCRGVACNTMRRWGASWRRRVYIVESRILYTGERPTEMDYLYRCYSLDDDCRKTVSATSWYMTKEEAEDAAKNLHIPPMSIYNGKKYYAVQTGTLNTEEIEPLSNSFTVKFQLDDKGRLYTRLNAHPELDGNISDVKGKIFFPDRSFTTADTGEAIVSISSEKDKFGFLTGEMVRFDDGPDLKTILDWAWSSDKVNLKNELVIINHPARGRYYALKEKDGYCRIMQTYFDEELWVYAESVYDSVVKADAKSYTEKQATFTQFFLDDAWGPGVSVDMIEDMFKESKFFEAADRLSWVASPKYHSKAIDDAVKKGILNQYRVWHIEVITYDWQNLLGLLSYTLDEVKQLAAEVSAINAKADETANNLRRKGKLDW